ncbi:MAG: response regulator transcription factor [Saprospiraceae bacterium]
MIFVAIVDSDKAIRDTWRRMLDTTEGFGCSGVYPNAHSALEHLNEHKTDVVLVDAQLNEISGVECVKMLKREIPTIDLIMLSSNLDDDEMIFQAFKAGACGFLPKDIFPSDLLEAIQEAKNGGAPMPREIARKLVGSFSQQQSQAEVFSKREMDVLDLLCEGNSYKEMAEKLFVSPNTIRFHLKNIYKKLDVGSRHEAVIKAMQNFLLM